MTDQITQLFNYLGNQVRVVAIKGEPWFVAVDIGNALGFDTTLGASTYVRSLPDEDKRTHERILGSGTNPLVFNGKRLRKDVVLISERGMYRLVMRSDKREARKFQDWVTGIVLPAIRKDGAYISGEEKVATGEMSEDELLLKAMNILQSKVSRLTAERDAALETVAQQDERLNFITVAEYLAMSKRYESHSKKVKLGQLAKMLCESRGLRTTKAHTTYTDRYGRTHNVVIGQYPREVLEEAEGLLVAA